MKRGTFMTSVMTLTFGLAVGYLAGASDGTANAAAPTFRSDNIYFQPAADPTGNGHPSSQLVYEEPDGTKHLSGFYVFEHNTAGLKGFVSNYCDTSFFETDVNGRFAVQYP